MVRKMKSVASETANVLQGETRAVAVVAAPKTPSQLAHELSDFAHARGALLAKGLIDGGQLAQAGAIATAAENLVTQIKSAFPYA